MKLLLRKNRLSSYNKQSGKTCPGFDKCLYPGSVINSEIKSYKDEPSIIATTCHYRQYTGPSGVDLSRYTRMEWEERTKQYWLCYHPNELTFVQEWRCYKCNAIVKSEHERHKCN